MFSPAITSQQRNLLPTWQEELTIRSVSAAAADDDDDDAVDSCGVDDPFLPMRSDV